jgi:hypothetical protein
MNGEKTTKVMREIPVEWDRLMQLASAIDRGRATIYFNEGRPVQVDFAVKKIKLDTSEDFKEKLKTIPLV